MHVPVCVQAAADSHGAVGRASRPGTKLERKPVTERRPRGDAPRFSRTALSRGCLLLLFQPVEMKHVPLAFRTNGFNKGRAKGVTLMAAETHQGSPRGPDFRAEDHMTAQSAIRTGFPHSRAPFSGRGVVWNPGKMYISSNWILAKALRTALSAVKGGEGLH